MGICCAQSGVYLSGLCSNRLKNALRQCAPRAKKMTKEPEVLFEYNRIGRDTMTEKETAPEHLSSLFSLAKSKFQRDNAAAGARYVEKFLSEVGNVPLEKLATKEMLSMLYQAGAHDTLLELFASAEGEAMHGMLPYVASAIFFSRNEPHNALLAAKYIQNPEQRRLRQKAAELWSTLHAPLVEEPEVHLLILTYNRVDYVEESLRQLGRTRYANYSVFIADNGSTDGTWDIAKRAAEFFPPHIPVHVQRFPTNIGRPAGHNWLLTGHDHSQADYIAIGDDDLISVPQNWLADMVQTAKAFPRCACVGGKAVSPGWPASVHAGIRNITDFGPGFIELTNNGESYDIGQFDFVDIVDHVIGCLHIFDRRALDDAGLFDIRFSPCQCVDIEHHLRMRLAGMDIVFNGFVHFVHLRGMGKAVQNEKGLQGNSYGNLIKLSYKYDTETVHKEIAARHEERNTWLME